MATLGLGLALGQSSASAANGSMSAAPAAAAPGGVVATQSSNLNAKKGLAQAAVDGNTDGNFRRGSVSHTKRGDKNPWWNAELKNPQPLRAITVWNRTDCCSDRLQKLTVRVSTTSKNACVGRAEYSYRLDVAGRPARILGLRRLRDGSYPAVRSVCIQKDSEFLSLAEVEFDFGENVITEGDDVITTDLDQIYTGWTDMVYASDGDDVVNSYAAVWGQDFIDKVYKKWWGANKARYFKYERHVYGGPGNDQLNMIFSPYIGSDPIHSGHHIYGDTGADTFNFVGVENINSGFTAVGRIDDFDVTQDQIQIEGRNINLNKLPKNVRVVAFNGDYGDQTARPQQWLLITNSQGGHIFYGLEGSRYWFENPGNDERHFLKTVPDFRTLPDVAFEDVHPSVPSSEYAGINPAKVRQYYSRDNTPQSISRNTSFGRIATLGSEDPAIVDVVHAGGGYDYVYAGAGNDLVAGGNSTDYLYGEAGDDRMWGGVEADEVYGGDGNDYLEGNYGNDLLTGGLGDDRILGGEDNDILYGDSTTDPAGEQVWYIEQAFRIARIGQYVDGKRQGQPFTVTPFEAGASRLVAIADDDTTLGNAVDQPQQGRSIDRSGQLAKMDVEGSREGGYLYTDGYYNVKNSTRGTNGRMYRLRIDPAGLGATPGGKKWLYVFDNAVGLRTGDQFSVVSGLLEGTNVDYSKIGYRLSGPTTTGGNDYLDGGAGDDELIGGPGNDQLVGGAGADTFVFDGNTNADQIMDFDPATDKIKLVGITPSQVSVSSVQGNAVIAFGANRITVVGRSAADVAVKKLVFA